MKKYYIGLLSVLFLIALFIYYSIELESFSLELLRTVFSGVTFISVFIALLNYHLNTIKQREDKIYSIDKELLEQAILSLKWAYNSLTQKGMFIPPKANRLNWLTSARHICRYNKISCEIKSDIYNIVCAEHEEYWRHKFYLALDHKTLNNKAYFMDKRGSGFGENIALNSATIIDEFSSWPENKIDPIDDWDGEVGVFRGPCQRGLSSYYEEYVNWVRNLQKREH